jgi:hypothetical protein
MENEEKFPHTQFIELYEETFRKALLNFFSDDIQKHYYVTGYAQMPGGKIVIRLERTLFPKEEQP